MDSTLAHPTAGPRLNRADLVISLVQGQIAHPVGRASPYRVGADGVPRVLPGTGGITLNWRVGDRCIGIAGDHVEPGVALHHNGREIVGPRNGPNLALITYACIGNRAQVASGPACGQRGWVTGKHGGVDHVLVDFAPETLRRLRTGDTVQIESVGQGLRLLDHPDVQVLNCAPLLLARWGLRSKSGVLQVPVTHAMPAALMGSGLGRNSAWRGDIDIQIADAAQARRWRLDQLRFGDLVCVAGADNRFGPSRHGERVTIGVVVHGDSTVSGHGPGVTVLLTGPRHALRPVPDQQANIARLLGIRAPRPPRPYRSLVHGPGKPTRSLPAL